MNYEYENIFDLEDIVLEQEYDMLNTLMDLIDKNELFIESGYVDNEAYDDFVNEMFQMYMESSKKPNRQKRGPKKNPTERNQQQKEIADYVVKNNLHLRVDGDNKPIRTAYGKKKQDEKFKSRGWGDLGGSETTTKDSSKKSGKVYQSISKKDQRRMTNTLLQHDFDPKTETIRSTVKNPDGSYKRIKLDLTDDDGGSYYSPADSNGDFTKKKIHINQNTMQSPQAKQQFVISHEDSHHYSNMMGGGLNKFKNQITDPNDIANHFIDERKKSGIYVNTHDDGSYNSMNGERNGEELHADLRGFQTARIRTPKWGSSSSGPDYKDKLNEGTRQLHVTEVLNYFKKMSDNAKKVNDGTKRYLSREYTLGKKAIDTVINTDKLTEDSARYIWEHILRSDKRSNERSDSISNIRFMKNQINTLRDAIEKCAQKLKELDGANNNSYQKYKTRFDEFTRRLSDCIKALEKHEKKLEEIQRQGKYDEADLYNYNTLNEIDKDRVSKKYAPMLKSYSSELEDMKKCIDSIVSTDMDIMETSTQMRYDFVMKYGNPGKRKKHTPGTPKGERLAKKQDKRKARQEALNKKRGLIKEYFEEFFNEYYSLEYLFE